jgi:hypothetical protein
MLWTALLLYSYISRSYITFNLSVRKLLVHRSKHLKGKRSSILGREATVVRSLGHWLEQRQLLVSIAAEGAVFGTRSTTKLRLQMEPVFVLHNPIRRKHVNPSLTFNEYGLV